MVADQGDPGVVGEFIMWIFLSLEMVADLKCKTALGRLKGKLPLWVSTLDIWHEGCFG